MSKKAKGGTSLGRGFAVKDGKVVPAKKRQSVSEHIRQRNSKKQRPVRRGSIVNAKSARTVGDE